MEKTILITGASSGIGLQTALTLKAKGYRVFATARKAADIQRLQQMGLETQLMDLTDSASIQQGLSQVLQRTNQQLYAVFNNAGIMLPGAVDDVSREMMQLQFETNVFGPMELIRLVLPIMRKQGYGRILQNSSILGVIPLPFYGAYNASKFALEGFTRTLRQELQDTKIKASLINPGPIKSELRNHALALYETSLKQTQASYHSNTYEQLVNAQRNNRDRFMLEPSAVANVVYAALEAKHPKMHYFITTPAKAMAILRRLLPESWLDWLLAKAR